MIKVKKYLLIVLSIILLFSFSGCSGCSDNADPNTPAPEQTKPAILLEQTNIQLNRGETKTIAYTLVELEGVPQWYSFNENVATVDASSGQITGVELGETIVVANIGEYSASCKVLVSEKAVEVKELKIELSSTKLVINADSEFNCMNLSASVIFDNQVIDAEVLWESSDLESVALAPNGNNVTVTALKNNTFANVTATVTYQGVTVSVVCEVICQGFHEIVFEKEEIKLFPSQTETVEFELFVDGVKNDQEKVNVNYSIKDQSVASVSSNGTITAIKEGRTQLVLTYKGRQFAMDVIVGEEVYVSTASQFMAIDGQEGFVRYVLQNDIDLSGYFKENVCINKTSLIDSFGGVIDGRGYTVSGWHRLKESNDVGFSGIFNLLTGDAKISNLGIKITVDTDVKAVAIANNNSAIIENCSFDLTFNSNKNIDKVLFSVNNGSVDNTIIKINHATNADGKMGVADSGIATYKGVSLIAPKLTYGAPNGVMINDNFSDCYYYESQADFINKNGAEVNGNGVGQDKTFAGSNYDQTVFVVTGDAIYLKNQNNSTPYVYSEVATFEYEDVNVGEQTQIKLPEIKDGQTQSFVVLDYSFSDVTDEICSNGKLTAKYTGEYYVVVFVLENGVYSYSMSTLNVKKVVSEINNTSVVLGNGVNNHTITVNGKTSSEFNYYSADQKVATVSSSGVITAVAEGSTTISVIEKNGQSSYSVLVTVINSYTEVSNYDSLVLALNNAIKGDYIVLTNDITIEELPLQFRYDENGNVVTHNGTPVPHAMIVDSFKGILDGQGHRIHLKFNSSETEYLMCGLFNSIEVGAEIRNLYYTFTAHYVPSGKFAAYTSTFTRSCSGVIRNCYLESYLYPTVSSGGMEGIIGYLSNKSISQPTAYVYDTIFKLQTEVDGVVQDGGHAIRAATANPYGYNNAFIRNSSNNEFYGTCSFTSALEGSGNIKYNTLYDFVNGKNGYFKSVLSVITKQSDGNIVYSNWGGEWDISRTQISLCGRKIADVYFEEYNTDSSIKIEDNKGVLSWAKEIGTVDIYINGKLQLTQSSNTFDVYEYVKTNYQPFVGEYKVIINSGAKAGAVLYKVIQLNNDNFIQVLGASNTKEAAMYKYYVFGEDITINSWKGTDRGDFVGGATQTLGYHVFDVLYGNVDALGHSLNVTVNTRGTTDRFGGFIGNNRCSWKNLVYNLKATYSAQVFGLFATNSWSGAYENCYFNISATQIDSTGNIIPDLKSSVINTPRGSSFTDCIVAINQTEDSTIMFLGDEISYPIFDNVIFIRNTESSLFTLSQYDNWKGRKYINCYHYRTLEDFVQGGKGVLIDVLNDADYVTMPIDGTISYANFSDVWTITEKEVKLLGNQIVKIFDTGDNVVNDEDIK
ncbi:MAG: hypothetical protein E7348_05805, partial [Clostridiales bacterium]|nr:hypothetical protein [Clostridiales bacterium]